MGLRITSNILSLQVQRNLSRTTRALSRALERLSSGNRVDQGRDDPAGLAIANRLDAQRRGMLQAIRNLNDSRGFLETADGALAEQASMVQRMRELAVQAANGTLNDVTRSYLDSECQALLTEFTRVTTQTQFNGVNLLDGSFTTKTIQVGAQKDQTIGINLTSTQSLQVFGQTTTGSAAAGDGTFAARTAIASGTNPYAVASADFNGDGKLDLVTADQAAATLSILLGNGNGTFQSRRTVSTGSTPQGVLASDLNGDGKIDLVSTDTGSGTTSIFLGNGDGTFKTRTTTATGTSPRFSTSVDTNGDEKLDLITVDSGTTTASIFLGNGDGTFATRTTIRTGSSPYSVVARDFNGDGKIDLATADNGSSVLSLFLGNGNGTFATRTTLSTSANPYDVISVDLNGDAIFDLITTESSTNTVSVYLGNGNGTFKTRITSATGSTPHSLVSVDVNGDSKLDLMVNDQGGSTISILLGNGNGTFQTRSTVAVGALAEDVNATDLNGDGILDLLSADLGPDTVSVLLGNGSTNSLATVPVTILLTTQSNAQDSLQIFDTALAYINSARASIGALQSRLESATNSNLNAIENISAARSQIIDTDMAAETAEFTRLLVLQKAGVVILSQANLNAQLSLKLLENI